MNYANDLVTVHYIYEVVSCSLDRILNQAATQTSDKWDLLVTATSASCHHRFVQSYDPMLFHETYSILEVSLFVMMAQSIS